jgi:pilus assembly protein CpaD
MKMHRNLVAVALLSALAACYPLTAEYTESEAPNDLVLDNASSHVDLRFAPGSSRLSARDAGRLRALAGSGGLQPSDRVTVAVAGSPGLARARFATIAGELLRYRIVASERLAAVPANQAIVETGRYLVTSPPCPNWSKDATVRFTNTPSSNFGCAAAVNLGQMVASPIDLAEGRPVGPSDAIPAAAAVQRYEADKVALPGATSLAGFAAAATGAPGAGTGTGSAGSAP